MIEDIRYLIVFAKVAEAGSFSRAAEALQLTTATISMHIAKLEKNLGAALLYRNTRKLSLTHDGINLLETAKSMLELYEKGIIEFKQRSVSTTNNLRVSMPAVLINSPAFMDQVGNFIKLHPDIHLDILCSDNRNDIISESIDVAFRVGDLPDSSLKAKPVFEFTRKVVASRALLNAYPRIRHPRDLAELPWIGLTMRPNFRTFINAKGERHDVRYVPRIRMDNVEAAYQLARRGAGLAAPPEFLARDDIAHGRIEEVLPGWSLSPLRVHAVWPSNISPSSVAYTLINWVYDALGLRHAA
ncbi:MAG TPA: LysR family transcriptional regulator [Noviherbaspirillum sp.]|uniref:LysR family transcriptional regulator n=1 Tax=Noviherbaspirillum sp. TaxID=1926288 RepID=UPI002D441F03|nr:LysR family transcriptional regulator [Noviherbaspirillum sp.]HYD97280.1 LysR family transcriptional regulator [Noviherbaspirillum sp.]